MCHDSDMDDGADAELRALRARAYAPGGDIADDPAALARLTELEARRRERAERAVGAPTDPAPVADEASSPSEDDAAPLITAAGDPEIATPSGTDAAAADAASPRPARRLRTVLTWAGSLVAVAVLAAGITLFATARTAFTATALPEDAAVTHLTTLLPTGAEQPPFLRDYGSDQARAFEPFFGLETYQVSWIDADASCILLMSGTQAEAASSTGWSSFGQGCSAGAFPAAVSFVVAEEYPDELREHFPDGSALQFVLTETGVDVFVSNAPAQPAI